jgi:hypothetical protein
MTYIPSIYGTVSTLNSIVGEIDGGITINGNGLIEGDCEDVSKFNTILINCISTSDGDVADTLTLYFSIDNITWNTAHVISIIKGTNFIKKFPILAKYFKLSYQNNLNAVLLGFKLQTIYEMGSNSIIMKEYKEDFTLNFKNDYVLCGVYNKYKKINVNIISVGSSNICNIEESADNGLTWNNLSYEGESGTYTINTNGNYILSLNDNITHIRLRLSTYNDQLIGTLSSYNNDTTLIMEPNINSFDKQTPVLNTRSLLYGQPTYGSLKPVSISQEGHLGVTIEGPRLPFGSIHTEQLYPIFQNDAVYGLNTSLVNTYSTSDNMYGASDGLFYVNTTATANMYSSIESRKRLKYRSGQGLVGRFTALYNTPASDCNQMIGYGHSEDGIFIGYKDTDFGILYRDHGACEIRTLTLTTATNASDTVKIVLNGENFDVPLPNLISSDGLLGSMAYTISKFNFNEWNTSVLQSTDAPVQVAFINKKAGSKDTGPYRFNEAPNIVHGISAGTFVQTRAGSAPTETFIPQADWNGAQLLGNDNTGFVLDPLKGNVFQFNIKYLGFGSITIFAELYNNKTADSKFVPIHTLKLANTRTKPSLSNPSLPFRMFVENTTNTTDIVLKSGSFAGFIEGQKIYTGYHATYKHIRKGAPYSDGIYNTLFTLYNSNVFNNKVNQSIINIISISGAAEHNNVIEILLVRNANLKNTTTDLPKFIQQSINSPTYINTTSLTCTFNNSQIIWAGCIGNTGNFVFNFLDDITIQPGEYLSCVFKSTSNSITAIYASINTREDQ